VTSTPRASAGRRAVARASAQPTGKAWVVRSSSNDARPWVVHLHATHNLATEDWERAFRINLLGAVNGIRAAVPVMRAQGSGSIVLTASVAGLTAWSHAAPYCATKAAVIQLAKVAAVEYARDRIRVNCVCPGTFLSGVHADLPPEAIDAIAARHPLGLASATDLVGAYSYLASDASRWTTGSALVVDGGYSAP
jgi:meso-butanediol dehydrogenase / (S,S)-butanediol dehydrogenase / diacetyl reductase